MIFTVFSPIYVQMMDLYLIFQFVKGRCHGNQIICERQVRPGQKTGVFVEYIRIYWTDFRNLFTIWKRFMLR